MRESHATKQETQLHSQRYSRKSASGDLAGAEATQMSPYLWALLGMLVSATVFDAFNVAILSTVAPQIQQLYGLNHTQWGLVNLVIRIGAVASFFVLMLADRFGRRPIITLTILGYAVFTGLTAYAVDVYSFTVWQFCARIFLAAEFALALIIIGEEYPTRFRSFGISLLAGMGAFGTILSFLTARWVLAHYDWRTMYLLGLVPVALVVLVRLGMRETRRFEKLQKDGNTHSSWREQIAALKVPFQQRYRARSLLVTLIWNCNHMVTSPAVTFWTIHAARNLNFTAQEYTVVVAGAYIVGFLLGAPLAGFLMNRVGRRLSCAFYYFGAAVFIFALFMVPTPSVAVQTVLMSACIVCFLGANSATSTYATELFPTEIRATGYSWTTNLFGRITEIATPLLIGMLADRIGIPLSVGIMAIGPVLGAILVLRYAPETRGKTLEQIAAELDRAAAR
ncbi:MAG: MFS transporter [Candidatus Binatia bacterium]|nr:MAG: MFS transporter [Candidatus Binatia bacterium]